jgi:hypothetical protein
MACRVAVNILADAERIWRLLTDAEGFPRWNSTVTSVENQIREGERLRLRAPGTDRVFTPKVSGVVPNKQMIGLAGSPLYSKASAPSHCRRARTGQPILQWRSDFQV